MKGGAIMKRIIGLVIFAFSIFLFINTAQGAAPKWEFDRDHSNIYFDVKHIYSTARGFFEDFSGEFFFDPNDKDASTCYIEVKVKSINTHIRRRDDHLRSDDFFSASKYPLITFKSTRINHIQGNQYSVEGRLTVKDVTKDITVPFTYFGVRDNPFDKNQLVAGFEARFKIDRLAYNVGNGKFYKMGVVGKEVEITVSLEMTKKK